jgi:hypothetical protein
LAFAYPVKAAPDQCVGSRHSIVSRSRSTSATPVAPTSGQTTTITKGVDANGNEITKKVTYREGITGSSETHTKTFTDPDGVADK